MTLDSQGDEDLRDRAVTSLRKKRESSRTCSCTSS
jgi:hypothetical protein